MIEIIEPKQFQWDHGNERKSSEKHNVSQAEAEQVFFNQPLLLLKDKAHSQKEIRCHALGRTDNNRKLHITFTIRKNQIRVISARPMHKKERKSYEKNS
ncbi:MAG: BrnT family toxin [Thermodesulfobacteriota bacterium]|nr:BrnT family toxin [Thermodesulfobacteriota bacterium]